MLAPGASEREQFEGPACPPGSEVTAVADPAGQVDDADRSNNTLTAVCPSASSRYTS
jgi:hypothetical protein